MKNNKNISTESILSLIAELESVSGISINKFKLKHLENDKTFYKIYINNELVAELHANFDNTIKMLECFCSYLNSANHLISVGKASAYKNIILRIDLNSESSLELIDFSRDLNLDLKNSNTNSYSTTNLTKIGLNDIYYMKILNESTLEEKREELNIYLETLNYISDEVDNKHLNELLSAKTVENDPKPPTFGE